MPPLRQKQRACTACRRQKKRCSGTRPCALCQRLNKACVSDNPAPHAERPSLELQNTLATAQSSQRSYPAPSNALQADLNNVQGWGVNRPLDQLSPFQSNDRDSRFDTDAQLTIGTQMNANESKAEGQQLCGTDLIGNLLEPASPYSWLYRARLRLGVAKSQLRHQSTTEDEASADIFGHGDFIINSSSEGDFLPTLGQLSWETLTRLLDVYLERSMVTYHFIHSPTVREWAERIHSSQDDDLTPQQRSITVLVLSHGSHYLTPSEFRQLNQSEAAPISTEGLFKLGMSFLDEERGRPTLESIQARLLQVHHLFSSSRPNQAWYIFGTVVQLSWALGLHRLSGQKESLMQQQLRRRTFWSIYSMDKYIGIAMGRPTLVHDEQISQELPLPIDDDDLMAGSETPTSKRDSRLSATVYHALLSKIVAKGISEQDETNLGDLLKAASDNQKALDAWRALLPPILSGAVHPSSLIPVFRRQAVVLRIFYLNAVILINRPLLICNPLDQPSLRGTEVAVEACLSSSKELALLLIQFIKESQRAETYWFTQNITFNAISIMYFYLLRSVQENGGLSDDHSEIYTLAQNAHTSLQEVSQDNAPSFRYCLVLDELKKEVQLAEVISSSMTRTALGSLPRLQAFDENEHDLGYKELQDTSQIRILPPRGSEFLYGSFWPWFDTLSTDM